MCVRLHPRLAVLAPNASKIGGMILWPSGEKWPYCAQPSFSEAFLREYGGPELEVFTARHNCHFEALLQLRKDEYPAIAFPQGTDLMQVLFCPHQHLDVECDVEPAYRVFWRREAEVSGALAAAPQIPDFPGRRPIRECRFGPSSALHPEKYPDYAEFWDCAPEVQQAIGDWRPPVLPTDWNAVVPESYERPQNFFSRLMQLFWAWRRAS